MSNTDASQKDNPIKLDSIDEWKTRDVKISEIIEEVLKKTWSVEKSNPFAIDHEALNTLPIQRSMILSVALVNFLKKVLSRNPAYANEGTN
jgi:hypothetical protein